MMATFTEHVPGGKVIWQSETAKTYKCPRCERPVFSQYEGQDSPTMVRCHYGFGQRVQDDGTVVPFLDDGGHTLEWA